MCNSASGRLKIDSDGGRWFMLWPTLGSKTVEERAREKLSEFTSLSLFINCLMYNLISEVLQEKTVLNHFPGLLLS